MDVSKVVAVAALVLEALVRLLPKGDHAKAWAGIRAHIDGRTARMRTAAQRALDARKGKS